jgi:molecular chaperone DnaJ
VLQPPTFDLYAELEVSPSASTPTIEAAYRALMKQHHPDATGGQRSSRAIRLSTAHEWLSDPARLAAARIPSATRRPARRAPAQSVRGTTSRPARENGAAHSGGRF